MSVEGWVACLDVCHESLTSVAAKAGRIGCIAWIKTKWLLWATYLQHPQLIGGQWRPRLFPAGVVFLSLNESSSGCISRCWGLQIKRVVHFLIPLLSWVHHLELLKEHVLLSQSLLEVFYLLHLLCRYHKSLPFVIWGNLFFFLLFSAHQMGFLLLIFFELLLTNLAQEEMVL